MAKMTERELAKIGYTSKGQKIHRTDTKGLFLRVGKATKAWTVAVDIRDGGKRRTITRSIGTYPDLSLKEASRKARAIIDAIKDGTLTSADPEPREEAPEPDAPITLGEAWRSYEAMIARKVENGTRSPVTLKGYVYLAEVVMANWHGEELRALATKAGRVRVADWHEELTRSRGRVSANRTMALLQFVYKHAIDFDLDEELPAKAPTARVEMNKENGKQKGLTGAELPEWNRVRLGLPNKVRQEFHLVTLLTGLRVTSLKTAKWSDLDRERRVLHIGSPKGGEDRAFDVPLSDAIIESLDRVKVEGAILNGRAARTWIFPGATVQGHVTETQERIALVKHDFAFGHRLRRSYKTFAGLAGVNEIEQMILLNHAAGSVSRAYVDRGAMAEALLAAQEKISKYILQEMSSN